MAKKEFKFRGKLLEELKAMSLETFSELLPSKERRKIQRGFTDAEKALLRDLEKHSDKIKTHCRDMVILPLMIGRRIGIHSGKVFVDVELLPEMVGHRLGEFVMTRNKVKHGAVGVASAIKH